MYLQPYESKEVEYRGDMPLQIPGAMPANIMPAEFLIRFNHHRLEMPEIHIELDTRLPFEAARAMEELIQNGQILKVLFAYTTLTPEKE